MELSMTLTNVALLCAVVFMIGFLLGAMKADKDHESIVQYYKDIIEEYRKSLVGTR